MVRLPDRVVGLPLVALLIRCPARVVVQADLVMAMVLVWALAKGWVPEGV